MSMTLPHARAALPRAKYAAMPHPFVRAYTLAEVLIVMAIFAILLALGVPAFNSAIKNSDEVSAENQLRIGLAIARDAAVQSSGAEDTAAVFFYTAGGRTSIVPYIKVGTLKQVRSMGADDLQASVLGQAMEDRDVFVPIAGSKTVQLPRGWMVRAFAPPGTLDKGAQRYPSGWYNSERILDRVYYQPETRGNWVFPETSFFRSTQSNAGSTNERATDGANRSSFMVRFRAGTGSIAVSDGRLAIAIDPSDDNEFRETEAPFNAAITSPSGARVFPNRIDRAEDVADFVRRHLKGNARTAQQLFGFWPSEGSVRPVASSDSVLCRPIAQLALYREADLALYLGARGVNRATGCIYGNAPVANQPLEVPIEPRIDVSLFTTPPALTDLNDRINAWIEGRLPETGTNTGEAPITTSKIFTFGTYLGQVLEFDDADGGGEN